VRVAQLERTVGVFIRGQTDEVVDVDVDAEVDVDADGRTRTAMTTESKPRRVFLTFFVHRKLG